MNRVQTEISNLSNKKINEPDEPPFDEGLTDFWPTEIFVPPDLARWLICDRGGSISTRDDAISGLASDLTWTLKGPDQ